MTTKTIAPTTTTSTTALNVSLVALLCSVNTDNKSSVAMLLGQEGHQAPHIPQPILDWSARQAALLQILDEVELILDMSAKCE
jgi:hypothetical protein